MGKIERRCKVCKKLIEVIPLALVKEDKIQWDCCPDCNEKGETRNYEIDENGKPRKVIKKPEKN